MAEKWFIYEYDLFVYVEPVLRTKSVQSFKKTNSKI